jgi:hypothetical protein
VSLVRVRSPERQTLALPLARAESDSAAPRELARWARLLPGTAPLPDLLPPRPGDDQVTGTTTASSAAWSRPRRCGPLNRCHVRLRHPEHLNHLRRDPDLLPRAVEELLRYEPPVHMRERIPRADIDVAGTTIPEGTSVVLVLASGNRDPMRFHEPDRFDPTRPDNQHLGFGSGIHLCYGAPLARIEAQAALGALIPHLGTAHLVEDPPPYRQNAMLRGPRHLPIQL